MSLCGFLLTAAEGLNKTGALVSPWDALPTARKGGFKHVFREGEGQNLKTPV